MTNDHTSTDDFPLGDTTTSLLGEKFHSLTRINRGGYATVYRAQSGTSDVAVKVLHLQLDEEAVGRLERETTILRSLRHPNIVSIIDVDPGFRWYSMPLAASDLSAMAPFLDPCEKAQLLISIARALEAAHNNKICHRDISPGNILWFASERAWKLADFGLASIGDSNPSVRLSTNGKPLGTWLFRSPEQELGLEATPRSDVFSLGQLAGWVVTGVSPRPQSPFDLADGPWRDVIGRMTQKRPDERLFDLGAVAAEFESVLANLREGNRSRWQQGTSSNGENSVVIPTAPSEVTLQCLRRILVLGKPSRHTLLSSAGDMGLTEAGVAIAIEMSLEEGWIESEEDRDRDGDTYFLYWLTKRGKQTVTAHTSPASLFAAPRPAHEDIPF